MKARHAVRVPPKWFKPEARYEVIGNQLELVIAEPRVQLSEVGRVAVVLAVGLPIGTLAAAVVAGLALIVFGVPR